MGPDEHLITGGSCNTFVHLPGVHGTPGKRRAYTLTFGSHTSRPSRQTAASICPAVVSSLSLIFLPPLSTSYPTEELFLLFSP